ncbi:MAG: shikimate kinase [Provencibacterium sp.]|jgi:shikimate kinase|nr:shikimate kinase [Provencibacterium sp.]
MGKAILLCGFMGSGKTTVGRLLAKKLFARFIDTDEYIEQQQKMSIPNIFREKGEQYFRALEHVALQNAVEDSGPLTAVVATGGGMMMDPDNIRTAQENGCTIIYLSTDFEICYERVCKSNRPLVMQHTKEELRALYEARHKVYSGICTTQMYNHQRPDTVVDNIISVVNPLSIQKL